MSSVKMHNCSECSFVAKSAGGLASHKRRHNGIAVNTVDTSAAVNKKHTCHSCHALPIGSVELVSLLLVLIFSLTAVLLTSVYAIDVQSHEIAELEARIN